MSKFQLHVSGIQMLSRCGIQFERRYLNGEKLPPGVAITIGSAVDRTVTDDLSRKIESGELLPAEAIRDYARDHCSELWDRGIELEDEYAELGADKARATAIDASVALASLHHEKAAPRIEPTHVQRRWTLDISGFALQLAGAIDIQEGLTAIRDTKTSGKSPNAGAADRSLQLTTYCLAVRQHDGRVPDKVALDYLVRTKTPKLVQLESTRTDAHFRHLFARIEQAARCIESGIFTPADPDHWACSKQFCGYWQTCPYAVHPVSVGT